MGIRLKPLHAQVIVITGASSGIGRATAQLAARQGARLVLACRDLQALDELAASLGQAGGNIATVQADVGVREDHERIAQTAMERYGRIDTWVNNAGVSIFGRLEEVPIEDQRKLFDTNFWGVVHGSLTALPHLKRHGGALINVGSEVSDRAVPLQGAYSASKHAVKAYTDALRMELEDEGAPVSVTLIKPASVATEFTENARNYMDVAPQLPPPVYAAESVAEAILFAAEHPRRDIYVGSASRLISAMGQRMPGLADRMGGWLIRHQRSDRPADGHGDGLYEPRSRDGNAALHGAGHHGRHDSHGGRHSAYTYLSTQGRGVLWSVAGVALAAGVMGLARRNGRH